MSIEELLEAIRTAIRNIVGGLTAPIRDGVDLVQSVANTIANSVRTTIGDFTLPIGDVIGTIYNDIVNAVRPALDNIGSVVGGIAQDVQNRVGGLISNATGAVGGFISNLKQGIEDALGIDLDNVGESLASMLGKIQSTIGSTLQRMLDAVGGAVNSVGTFISNSQNFLQSRLTEAKDAITGFVSGAIQGLADGLGSLLEQIRNAIQGGLDALGNLVNGVKNAVTDGLSNLIQNIRGALQSIMDALGPLLQSLLGGIGDALVDIPEQFKIQAGIAAGEWAGLFTGWWRGLAEERKASMMRAILPLAEHIESLPALPPHIRQMIGPGQPYNGVEIFIFWLVGMIGTILVIPQTVATIELQETTQRMWSDAPLQPLTPEQSAAAVVQGHIPFEQGAAEALKVGINGERFKVMFESAGEPPGTGTTLELLNRKFFSEAEAKQAIAESRLKPKYTEAILKLRDILPPVSDIIRMAVREAFSPEIAERFGQYEDFPPAVAGFGRELGLSEEWAKRYWAAHWDLPSATQGFEMFQRGIIDRGDLLRLLRALDVMPFWRDRLIEMSYNVITRVDARRMHQLGVLSDTELAAQYRKIGYSPDDAEKLARFTIAYNKGELKKFGQAERDLSKAEILSAYAELIITRPTATQMLKGLGYDPDEVEIILAIQDFKSARGKESDEIKALGEEYRAGLITRSGLVAALDRLGLSQRRRDAIVLGLDRGINVKTTLPNEMTLHKMRRYKIITEDEEIAALKGRGYSDLWARRLAKLPSGST